MKKIFLVIYTSILISGILLGQTDSESPLLYLNQHPPGLIPQKFAPDIISTNDEYEFGSAISKKADKIFYVE